MIEWVVNLLGSLGVDVSAVSPLLIVIGAIVAAVIVVRLVLEVADDIFRIGCSLLVLLFAISLILDLLS